MTTTTPRSVRALTIGTTVVAAAGTAALASVAGWDLPPAWTSGIAAALAVAEAIVVSRRMGAGRWSWSVSEAIVALALFVVPPAAVVLAVATGVFVGGYRRIAVKRVFNTSQHALAAATAGVLVHLLGGPTVATVTIGMIGYLLVNNILVAAVVRMVSGKPVPLAHQLAAVSVGWAASTSLGLVASRFTTEPLYLLLLALPLLAVRVAYQAQTRRAERERALRKLYEQALSQPAGEARTAEVLLATVADAFGATRVHLELRDVEGTRTWTVDGDATRTDLRSDDAPVELGATLVADLPHHPDGPDGRLIVVDAQPDVGYDAFDRELARILAVHAAPTLRHAIAAEQRDAAVELLRELNLRRDAVGEELARLARDG